MLSKSETKYLKNKHKGGRNNQKGNQYESFYAVHNIVTLLNQYAAQLDDVALQAQLELCFVDDLLIYYPHQNVYHQIKDVKALTWNTGTSQPVSYDFKKQVSLCKSRKENFHLKLVFSNIDCNLENKPCGVKKYTTVEYFPAYETLNAMVFNDTVFCSQLAALLHSGYQSPIDKLSDFANIILGFWDSGINSHPVTLHKIEDYLKRNVADYISNPSIVLPTECKSIFDEIPSTRYFLQGNTLCFEYNGHIISFMWSDELAAKIIEKHPMSVLDILNIENDNYEKLSKHQ